MADYPYNLEEEPFIGCKVFSEEFFYKGEFHQNKKLVLEEIQRLFGEGRITLENVIFLLEKLSKADTPNISFIDKDSSTSENLLQELTFLKSFLEIYQQYCNLRIAMNAGLPCILQYEEIAGCQLFFQRDADEMIMQTIIFYSREEIYNWLSSDDGAKHIPDIIERENLKKETSELDMVAEISVAHAKNN